MSSAPTSSHEFADEIRILHVDDEPRFAEMAATFVQRHDERFVVETATSAGEALDRLEGERFDCVVSDYDMPGQNGIEFLESVRESHPELPFVLFTGKGSEAVASDAISAGVSDYLQKGTGTERYSLLANRIDNLVAQFRAQARLEDQAEQQRRVAELGQTALAGESLDGLLEAAVTAVAETLDSEYAKVLEYRPERDDLLLRAGHGWRDGLVGEATVGTGEESQAGHTLRSAEPIVVEELETEARFRGPPLLVDHDVVSGISVVIGSPDEPWGVLGVHTTEPRRFTEDDITFVQNVAHVLANTIERLHRETALTRSEARYRAIAEHFPNGLVALFDEELRYELAHGTAFERMDLTAERMEGACVQDLFDEAVLERLVPALRGAIEGDSSTFEMTFQGRRYRVHTVPVEEGRQGMVMSQDITEEMEDKHRLETLLDNFQGYIYRHRVEPGWPLAFVEGSAEAVTGYSADELEDLVRAEEVIHPEDREYVWNEVEKNLESGDAGTVTYRIVTKDGEERWVLDRSRLVDDPVTGEEFLEGFVIDFTEEQTRQRELEWATRRLDFALEEAQAGIWEWNLETDELYWSEEFLELLGIAPEAFDGTIAQFEDRLHPDDRDRVETAIERTIETGEPYRVEQRLEHADGEYVWFDVRGQIVAEESLMIGIGIDVTDRKERELALDRYRTLVETVGDSMYILDEDGTIDMVNRTMSEQLGADPAAIVGVHASEFLGEGDFERGTDVLREVLADPEREWGRYEATVVPRSGERYPSELNVAPLTDEEGSYIGSVGVARDITERKAREEELTTHKENLEHLLEAVTNLYAAESIEECHEITIETAVSVLGFDWCTLTAPAEGSEDFEIVAVSEGSPVDVGERPFKIDEGVAGHVYQTKESHLTTDAREEARGKPVSEEIRSALTIPVGEWGVFQAVGTEVEAFDETDRRHAELLVTAMLTAIDRVESRLELAQQNDRLSEFTSVVSHDLRNPLHVARGWIDLAIEEGEDEYLPKAAESLDRMEVLIEDLLSLAEEGRSIGETEVVSLGDVARGGWSTVETADAELAIETAMELEADRSRLQQLFENLVRNAVQHGGDDVTVTVGGLPTGFYVADTGPGISPDERDRVFDVGFSTDEDGKGFGLSIVAEIVAAHGWAIEVTESDTGGARFEITDVIVVE